MKSITNLYGLCDDLLHEIFRCWPSKNLVDTCTEWHSILNDFPRYTIKTEEIKAIKNVKVLKINENQDLKVEDIFPKLSVSKNVFENTHKMLFF